MKPCLFQKTEGDASPFANFDRKMQMLPCPDRLQKNTKMCFGVSVSRLDLKAAFSFVDLKESFVFAFVLDMIGRLDR